MKADKIIFDAEVSDRKILRIPVNTIIATSYNPKERTAEGAKLTALTETVKRYGVIQPVIITDSRDLVDGNRRLAAAKKAGMSHIDCIILPASVDKDAVFGDLNTTSEKIGNRGWLYICRHGIRNPPKDVRASYQELHKLVGNYGVDLFSAIINPPQVAILGMARASRQNISWDFSEEPSVKELLPVSVTFDHSIIDGSGVAEFLKLLQNKISEPENLWDNV